MDNLLCSCLCVCNVIVELHAMNEKVFNDILTTKQEWIVHRCIGLSIMTRPGFLLIVVLEGYLMCFIFCCPSKINATNVTYTFKNNASDHDIYTKVVDLL